MPNEDGAGKSKQQKEVTRQHNLQKVKLIEYKNNSSTESML